MACVPDCPLGESVVARRVNTAGFSRRNQLRIMNMMASSGGVLFACAPAEPAWE
jgi:hypothetical protein